VGLGGRRNRRHHRTERRQQVQLAPDEPPLQVERPAEVGLLGPDGGPPRKRALAARPDLVRQLIDVQ